MAIPGEVLRYDGAQFDDDNPWPGLTPYGERDGAYFKGREAEIGEMLRLLRRHRVSVLYGASGLGKTSLLRAGLSPRLLAQGELPVHLRLDFSNTAAPLMEQVFGTIAACAALHQVEPPLRAAGEALWTWLHRRGNGFWGPRNQLFSPVLMFDQFEEVFTRGLASEGRAAAVRRFLNRLADLVEGRPPKALMACLERQPDAAARFDFAQHRYRIVISLREDFLAPLDELRSAMPSIMLARYRLQPMDGRQALRVADQTRGRLVDTEVSERIVRLVAGRPLHEPLPLPLDELRVDSALLGLFCRELNRRRQQLGLQRITLDLVHEGHHNILENFYADCIGRVAPALRRYIENELITANGHRDSRVLEDALLVPGIAAADIDTLIDARLLRTEERNSVRRIELSHDVLTGVVRRSRDARQVQEQLEVQQAQERERLEREKKDTQHAAEQKAAQQARRGMYISTGLGLVAVVFAVLSFMVGRAEREARLAETRARHDATVEAENRRSQAAKAEASYQAASAALDAARRALEAAQASPAVQAQARQALLSDAVRSYDAARHETQEAACPVGRRVYPHADASVDKARLDTFKETLRGAGFVVPVLQIMPDEKLPSRTEVRYFRPSEVEGARAAAEVLRNAGLEAVEQYVKGYESSTSVRPCHYELWLKVGVLTR